MLSALPVYLVWQRAASSGTLRKGDVRVSDELKPNPLVIETFVIRLLIRGLLGLALLAALVYVGDWAVWRVRVAMGGGMGQEQVSQMTSGSMKGGKTMYFFDGTSMVDCSRSLFPQSGAGACWWVKRHPVVVEQY